MSSPACVSSPLCLSRFLPGLEWRAQLGQKVARLQAPRRPLQAVPEDDAGGGLCKQNHSKVQCWEGGTTQSSPGCDLGSNLGKRNVGSKNQGQASPCPMGKNDL